MTRKRLNEENAVTRSPQIDALIAMTDLDPYQTALRDQVLGFLADRGKGKLGVNTERYREIERIANAADPCGEIRRSCDGRRRSLTDEEKAQIRALAQEGETVDEIQRVIGCRTKSVIGELSASGNLTAANRSQVSKLLQTEPLIDLILVYADAELQVAVLEYRQLSRVALSANLLCEPSGEQSIPSETSNDQSIVVAFEAQLLRLRYWQTVHGIVPALADQIGLLADTAKQIADRDVVVLYHSVSGRPERFEQQLKGVFCNAPHLVACGPSMPDCLLRVIAQPQLTRLTTGFLPSLSLSTERMADRIRLYEKADHLNVRPEVDPFCFVSESREAMIYERVRQGNQLRATGFIRGVPASSWITYQTHHYFDINASSAPYLYCYSDGVVRLPGKNRRVVSAVSPVDFIGLFERRVLPALPAAENGVWQEGPLKCPTATVVVWPELRSLFFRALARRGFATLVKQLDERSLPQRNPRVKDQAAFWLRRPFRVCDQLKKLRGPEEEAMAVGLGLTIFGADLVLRVMTDADRARCCAFAREVNDAIWAHVASNSETILAALPGYSPDLFSSDTQRLCSGNLLVVRSFLLEARRAFATELNRAAGAGVALMSLAHAKKAVRAGYGFGTYWPTVEVSTARLLEISVAHLRRGRRGYGSSREVSVDPGSETHQMATYESGHDPLDEIVAIARWLSGQTKEAAVSTSKEDVAAAWQILCTRVEELPAYAAVNGMKSFKGETVGRLEEEDLDPTVRARILATVRNAFTIGEQCRPAALLSET